MSLLAVVAAVLAEFGIRGDGAVADGMGAFFGGHDPSFS
jgi:hypothetical protein